MLRIYRRDAKFYEPEEVVEYVKKGVGSVDSDKPDILMRHVNTKP